MEKVTCGGNMASVCNVKVVLTEDEIETTRERYAMVPISTKAVKTVTYILSLYISFVFVQSLFFKFQGSPETQHIFGILDLWAAERLGLEGMFLPPGIFNAYVIGSAELVASVLLLTGLFTSYKLLNPLGALMALGIISGAIFFHLFTPLGIEVQGDGGALFMMAVGVWVSSIVLVILGRKKLCAVICCCCKKGSCKKP